MNVLRCEDCRRDRKKCVFTDSSPACERCLAINRSCTRPQEPPNRPHRLRALNTFKCASCRKSKQACQLKDGDPSKGCERCVRKGLQCSGPSKLPYTRASRQSLNGDAILRMSSNSQDEPGDHQSMSVAKQPFRGTPSNETHEIIKSLSFEGIDTRSRNICQPLPGTTEWILSHSMFKQWVDDSKREEHNGFLWIKGKPGSGKSTLMKYCVERMHEILPAQTCIQFFFDATSKSEVKNSSLGLLRSLLHQLLSSIPKLHEYFLNTFQDKFSDGRLKEPWRAVELQNFFISLIGSHKISSAVSVFIDGLDEGNEPEMRSMLDFLDTLMQHSTAAGNNLRICLASRHYPLFSNLRGLSIVLDNNAGHELDIEAYVRKKLLLPESHNAQNLHREVCCHAQGIFLWAGLVVTILNSLYDQGAPVSEISTSLNTMPADMNSLFDSMIFQDNEDIEQRLLLLYWVLYALRPLEAAEINTAINSCTSGLYRPGDLFDSSRLERSLLHRSRGLLEISSTLPRVVTFIHETVKEFLATCHHRLEIPSSPRGFQWADFQPEAFHARITETCVEFLIGFQQVLTSSTCTQPKPFGLYAAEHWWQHARRTNEALTPHLVDLIHTLLTRKENLLAWVRLYDVRTKASNPSLRPHDLASPLYYATWTGLLPVVAKVMESNATHPTATGRHGNVLELAAAQGNHRIVTYLIQRGADVDVRGEYGPALEAASKSGHLPVVNSLLNHGADVNRHGDFGNTPLSLATKGGHVDTVSLLLSHGADVNVHSDFGTTPLGLALQRRDFEMAELLLRHGADVNAQTELGTTPLGLAVKEGHLETVKLLLIHGANVNKQSELEDIPIRLAASAGQLEIVSVLLDYGADVNAQRKDHGTALEMASKHGHTAIVALLLDHGANVDGQTGANDTMRS